MIIELEQFLITNSSFSLLNWLNVLLFGYKWEQNSRHMQTGGGWRIQQRTNDCHLSIMQGRQADSQELWCVIWLDSAVTVSCNLQLPAFSKPTSISGRDVNGTDQRGVRSRGIGTLALIMSNPLLVHFPSLLSSGPCFPSTRQSFRDMKRAIQMSRREVLMLHGLTFFFCFLYSLSQCCCFSWSQRNT